MPSRPIRVFTAFDYDHDEQLKNLPIGQSRHPDTPFELCDWSVNADDLLVILCSTSRISTTTSFPRILVGESILL
jgi:hypothetical protein